MSPCLDQRERDGNKYKGHIWNDSVSADGNFVLSQDDHNLEQTYNISALKS